MALTNVYTGANGTLTLAFEDTPEGNDAKAIIDTYQITTVGRVANVEVCIQTDLEEFHEIGRRHATSLHPGNVHISGRVGRAYINGALLFLQPQTHFLSGELIADRQPGLMDRQLRAMHGARAIAVVVEVTA